MFILRTPLFLLAEAGDNPGAGGGGGKDKPLDAAAAIAQAEDRTLPISQRLGVAISALKGVAPAEQFAKVKTDLEAATTKLATVQGELTTANAQIKALQTDVSTLEASNAELEKKNKELLSKEQDLTKRVDAQVKEKMAALGFPASQLPAPTETGAKDLPKDDAAMEDALKACKTQEERSGLLRSYRARS